MRNDMALYIEQEEEEEKKVSLLFIAKINERANKIYVY